MQQSDIPDVTLRFLLRAGEAISESLDYERTLTNVVQQAVPDIADWCAVDLLDAQGRLRRLAVAHPDPEKIALAQVLQSRYPDDPNSETGTYARLRRRSTDWMEDIPDEVIASAARDQEHLTLIRQLGLRSYIAVPLVADENALGLLTLVYAESGRRYSQADVRVAEELGRRAALAIRQARLHAEVQDVASRLEQQALELELQTQQLQDQAAEMEAQQTELEAAVQDLSDANERLREGEAFARGILDAISDPMVVYDDQFRMRHQNAAASTVFHGIGRSTSMVGKVLWDEFPDLKGTAFEREMRRAADSREPVSFTEYRASSGAWTDVRCYPLPAGGIAAVWKDITAQKRAEETLHFLSRAGEILGSSLDYEETIGALAQLVVPRLADWCTVSVLEADGSIRQLALAHADPAKIEWARELTRRYPPDPTASRGIPQVIRSGEPEFFSEITDEMLSQAARDEQHLAMIRAVGFTSAITVPLAARGRTFGAMSLITAESRRRFTAEDLQLTRELAHRAATAVDNARLYRESFEARQRAEDANSAKTAFLANMSHELRTPLNAIAGYAELLELGVRGPLNTDQRTDVSRIQRSQRHLLSLINEVLNYAKVDAGRVQYNIEALLVIEAIADLDVLFAPQMRDRDMEYELTPPGGALRCLADAEKLRQILLNLMSNAVKFSQRGGRITVSVAQTGPTIEIRVSDTGIGIPEEKLESIFEPFVQLRFAGSTNEGVGLGLAISRDLARGMGGDLVASSTPGQGSTFTVRLPSA